MPDLLVKLYTVPDAGPALAGQAAAGITVRKPIGPEHRLLCDWMAAHFSDAWASELQAALANRPPSCFIAHQGAQLLGIACYDATLRGFFGPIGVAEPARRHGTGTALLLACLHDMRAAGYGYAVIGGAGDVDFYQRSVAAVTIADSSPGVYQGMLRR